jgi:glutamate-1-semialdehyde 2,1-aminomutase
MKGFAASNAHMLAAHDIIPGGAHTYAKGDDQYPADMAPALERGSGCRVWDIDGNEYVEFGSGLRSNILGHGFEPVVDAARGRLADGVNFVRPHWIERAAAERIVELIPSAEMVKFGLNGSDATTAAVRLARAYTGRDVVAVCRDQPFFSTDDVSGDTWCSRTPDRSVLLQRPAGPDSSLRQVPGSDRRGDAGSRNCPASGGGLLRRLAPPC